MNNTIAKLESLLVESDSLLEKQTVTLNKFKLHKSNCDSIFKKVISMNINSFVTDIAQRGLSFKITKLTNPFYQWIFSRIHSRDAITFNAPYLIKHTDSDCYKRYVFWTKQRVSGIFYNMNNND